MALSRRTRVRASVLAVSIGVLAAVPSSALGDLPDNGTEVMTFVVDENYHTGRYEWSSDSDRIFMRLGTSDFSLNKCADQWFDWRTGDDRHYDNRHIRTCKPYSQRENNGYDEPSTERSLTGVNRMAMCMWLQLEQDWGRCKNHGEARYNIETEDPVIPNSETRSWVRYQDGHVAIFGGGDPTSQ